MTELGWVEKTAFLHQERRLMELYAEGRLAMEDYMDFSLAPIAGRTPAEIAGAVEDFVARIVAPRIHADAVRCLERHRQAGDRLLIISASAHFLVSAIGRRLGVDEVLAIDIEERDGLYTGRTRGTLTYREARSVASTPGWPRRARRWPARPSIPTRATTCRCSRGSTGRTR